MSDDVATFVQILDSCGRVDSYAEFDRTTPDGPKVLVSPDVDVEVVEDGGHR